MWHALVLTGRGTNHSLLGGTATENLELCRLPQTTQWEKSPLLPARSLVLVFVTALLCAGIWVSAWALAPCPLVRPYPPYPPPPLRSVGVSV